MSEFKGFKVPSNLKILTLTRVRMDAYCNRIKQSISIECGKCNECLFYKNNGKAIKAFEEWEKA